ncbi:MAG: aminoglycoside phosphotransferase family protein [Actinomycetota bacterium]|nr:aminoglycoside phosphotransferase family protein [Actinomycetota bacterium]
MGDELAQIAKWRANVGELVTDCCLRWDLRAGEPYVPGAAGYVVRVERADGTPAVLKVFWPHREAEQEADALERWDGEGAVRLLARDNERSAMLLERCEPGSFLSTHDDPVGVLVELLRRLWRSGDGFRPLADDAEWWLEHDLAEVPDKRLRDAAVHYLRELVPTQGEQVLLHQDLHGENVLAAQREPWLVIDPKPLAGEREFSVAPIVRSSELGHSKRHTLYRLDRLCSELDLDRDRALGWTIAQTMAWSDGDEASLDTARWLLEDA